MEQLIKIHPSKKKELMAEFGTSLESVLRALCFETNSYLARKIRERALSMGGVLLVEVTANGEHLEDDGRHSEAAHRTRRHGEAAYQT